MTDDLEPHAGGSAGESLPVDSTTLDAALSWVRQAGELTLGYFRDPQLAVDSKGDGTPVTVADREAEALLRARIGAMFPDDGIAGEEQGTHSGPSGRQWVIDPIDGTKAFSRGVGTYSNLLALTDDQGPLIGIINLPALGETLWAVRGQGTWFNGRRIEAGEIPATSPSRTLEGKVLCVSGFHDWTPDLHRRAADAGVLVRTWGDAYGYALVASRRADAMFDPQLEWWDLAAPSLVVREAAGVVTNRAGSQDLRPPQGSGPYAHSAIASSDHEHDLWVELLN